MNVQQFLKIKEIMNKEDDKAYTIYTELVDWKGLNGNKPKSFTSETRYIHNRELVRIEYMTKCILMGDIVLIEMADCSAKSGQLYNERKYYIPVDSITHLEIHKIKEERN